MLALALALSSSLCWGISDFIGGMQVRRFPLLRVMLVSQGVGLVGLAIAAAVRGATPPEVARLLPAVVGGVAGIAALAAFYRALAIGKMSIVAPISATGVAVPVIVGVAGGDRPAALQLAGIAAAIIGVVLASREHGPGVSAQNGSGRSIGLALLAALGFGSFFVGMRISARADVGWALLSARAASVAALAAAAIVFRRRDDRPRSGNHAVTRLGGPLALLALAAIGFFDLAANVLYAFATRHGLLSVVAVAASLYPLATVLLARLVLGERVRRIQEVGIAAAVTGVVLIAAG